MPKGPDVSNVLLLQVTKNSFSVNLELLLDNLGQVVVQSKASEITAMALFSLDDSHSGRIAVIWFRQGANTDGLRLNGLMEGSLI